MRLIMCRLQLPRRSFDSNLNSAIVRSFDDERIPVNGLKVYAVSSAVLGDGLNGKASGLTYEVLAQMAAQFGLLSSSYVGKILEAAIHNVKEIQYEPTFNYISGNLIDDLSREMKALSLATARGRDSSVRGVFARRSHSRSSSRSDRVRTNEESGSRGRKVRPKSAGSSQSQRRKVLTSIDTLKTTKIHAMASSDLTDSFEELQLESAEISERTLHCYTPPARFIYEYQGKPLRVTWLGTRLLQQPSTADALEIRRVRDMDLPSSKKEQFIMDVVRAQDEKRMRCFETFLGSVRSQKSNPHISVSFDTKSSRKREAEGSSGTLLSETRICSALGR